MIRITNLILLAGMMVFLVSTDVGAFGDESYERQQSQSDKGFEDFDKEFGGSEAVQPPAPQVIIKEKIIIKEKLVPVPRPESSLEPTTAPAKPSTRGRKVVSNGYRFDFQSCTLSNRNVECDVMVRTPNTDKTLILYPHYNVSLTSSAFDNLGNQYYPSSIMLGNKDSTNSNHSIKGRLIQGITTKIKIYFENVSSETSSISLLELQAEDNRKRFKVQFRNIPFAG